MDPLERVLGQGHSSGPVPCLVHRIDGDPFLVQFDGFGGGDEDPARIDEDARAACGGIDNRFEVVLTHRVPVHSDIHVRRDLDAGDSVRSVPSG
ncbi:hypothetical protein ACIP4U_38915 [Streptomyces caelestis]|uniref:hypothetical protein n=1 Tax=Streptomyces caelestis TaxID=36816 RepID=UPI0037FB5D00